MRMLHRLERFRFTYCHLKIVQGGFFLRKKPLGIVVSVCTRIESAVTLLLPESCGNVVSISNDRCTGQGD